ncbi:MAG: hypothetical protein ACE5HO_20730 [bacterium]
MLWISRTQESTSFSLQREEALARLKGAMWPNWAGGAYAAAINDGEIAVGNPVTWLDAP